MSSRPDLRIDWCSYEAAKYAVEHWHYSKTITRGRNQYIGVWENEQFVGVVVFGHGAAGATDGRRFGLKRSFEVAEIVRVALGYHKTAVSKIFSISIRMVKRKNPNLRLLISYADPEQLHHGGIYQAGNWLYVGDTSKDKYYIDKVGRKHHSRSVSKIGYKVHCGKYTPCLKESDACSIVETQGKHRYLYPLDKEMRKQIAPLAKPYPKRAGSVVSDAPAIHAGEGGATPTSALQVVNV